MRPKKKESDPEVIRLTNLAHPVVNSFTITNISEQDTRILSDGCVPAWLQKLAEFYYRDHPKPSDKPPAIDAVDPVGGLGLEGSTRAKECS